MSRRNGKSIHPNGRLPSPRPGPAGDGGAAATADLALPHNLEAELWLLGACLIDNDAVQRTRSIVSPEAFFRRGSGILYRLICGLVDRGVTADIVTIRDAADAERARGYDEPELHHDHLLRLHEVPSAANAQYHAAIVQEHYRRRTLIGRYGAAIQDLYRGVGTADDVIRSTADVEARGGFQLRALGCSALDELATRRSFIVGGLIVEAQPCIVGGPRKSLKTSFMVALALSIATGRPFLGRFAVDRPRRVLFITGESGEATTQETARRIARSMGLQLADVGDECRWSFELPTLTKSDHVSALRRELKDAGTEVLIVDPLYLALMDDGGELEAANLFSMGPALRRIGNASLEIGVTPLLVHHLRKNRDNPDDPPELEDLAFAGVQEYARQWLLLGRRTPYAPGTGRHELWLNYGGSAGHSGAWAVDVEEGVVDADFGGRFWQATLTDATTARHDLVAQREAQRQQAREAAEAVRAEAEAGELDRMAEAVATYLRLQGPKSRRVIRDHLGFGDAKVGRILARAEWRGWIRPAQVEVQTGRSTRPVDGFEYVNLGKTHNPHEPARGSCGLPSHGSGLTRTDLGGGPPLGGPPRSCGLTVRDADVPFEVEDGPDREEGA